MKILVTGGTGCIGAATVRSLLSSTEAAEIQHLTVASRNCDPSLLRIWQGNELDQRIELKPADLGDPASIGALLQTSTPTHVIHLAALQSPACAADPLLGCDVNLGGTLSLLEQLKTSCPQLKRFVFASSAAVYGRRAFYEQPTIPESVPLAPPNMYGVWKLAGEQLARLYHEETSVPTVCLRLNTTYGPGRDQGLTSAPTTAIKHVVAGALQKKLFPYEMPYQGRENYHYVEDVGAHFAACCQQPFDGFSCYNIKGQTIPISQFLQTIESVADMNGWSEWCSFGIASDAAPNLFVCDLENDAIDKAFPQLPITPIEQGIDRTMKRLYELAERNQIKL